MKPFISIGITTYKNISDAKLGRAIYESYEDAVPKLLPNEVKIWSTKYPIHGADDFAKHWCHEASFTVTEDRGKGAIIDKGIDKLGAEWKRKGHGGGRVDFRPENQPEREDTILIKHPYLARSNWFQLFNNLIHICEPSYAMMHLFTEKEIKGHKNSRFEFFDGAFAGEAHFTHWQVPSGVWRKPDRWEHKMRRTYRFLPELSWANFLGKEFDSQFDPSYLERHSSNFVKTGNGILFTITNSISDVIKEPTVFNEDRLNIRKAFQNSFFRLPKR